MAEETTIDELPEGWVSVKDEPKEKSEEKLPEGWKPVTKEPEYRDVVSENLRAQGYEPDFSEELERAGEAGQRNALKSLLSGTTFGISENIPGLKPEEGAVSSGFKVAGSLLPLSKMIGLVDVGATALASASPVLQTQIGSLLSILGVGVVGGVTHGIETLAKGELPDADEMLEHGAEWAFLDGVLRGVGTLGKFGYNLLKTSEATGVNRKELVNRVVQGIEESGLTVPEQVEAKAFEILQGIKPIEGQAVRKLEPYVSPLSKAEQAMIESDIQSTKPISSTDLKLKKIEDRTIKRMETEVPNLAEPVTPNAADYSAQYKKLEESAVGNEFRFVADRAATEEVLGTAIKEDIEKVITSVKSEYSPLYTEAETAAEALFHTPTGTAEKAGKALIELSELKTKPAGYAAVLKNLETALEDAGYVIQRSENGAIESITTGAEVPVSKTIKLAKRLNEIIDYEAVEPTVKDALKGVKKAAKTDIRNGLGQNPDALTAFEIAEEAHAKLAKKYTRDSIRKIRGEEAGEKVARDIDSPTTLKDLKEILSPKQFAQVEREILEKLNTKKFDQAQKYLREIEDSLTKETKKIARDLVESKNPHNPRALRNQAKKGILDDVSEAFTTGQRPKRTMEIWKTKKGQHLVEEALEGSPNKKEVVGYLQKQAFNDMVESVIDSKTGKFSKDKFNEFMKDPAALENIRGLGGEEAVKFFRNLDTDINYVIDNANRLSKIPTPAEATRGQQILRHAKEKPRPTPKVPEVGKKTLIPVPTAAERLAAKEAKKASIQRGERILERMKQKDYPVQAKFDAWAEWIKETLGLNPQAALTVFGAAKLGTSTLGSLGFAIPATVSALVGKRMLNKMTTSPKVRQAFLKATREKTSSVGFLLAWEEFGETLNE